jgi:hypothetical protein
VNARWPAPAGPWPSPSRWATGPAVLEWYCKHCRDLKECGLPKIGNARQFADRFAWISDKHDRFTGEKEAAMSEDLGGGRTLNWIETVRVELDADGDPTGDPCPDALARFEGHPDHDRLEARRDRVRDAARRPAAVAEDDED